MPLSEHYRRQVALLVRTIPLIAPEPCFALKGGTAINLFIRDMPRLSVDIDLTYLPVSERAASLAEIDAAMRRVAVRIEKGLPGARVSASSPRGENCITTLLARVDGVQIKIEVTPVLRGCVYDAAVRPVCERVEALFGFAEMQVVSFADLYAGKIMAAMDRQHPRDLFDVRDLLANEGIGDELRKAFLVYLISHNRPMAEVMAPQRLDLAQEFERGFEGMTDASVTLEDLLGVREQLIGAIVGEMPRDHRRFLLSVKRGEPDWGLLGIPAAERLPAVRWKLENLARLDAERRSRLLGRLEEALGATG